MTNQVLVEISTDETSFSISAKTAYGGQPAPPCPPGSCPGLWDYEVRPDRHTLLLMLRPGLVIGALYFLQVVEVFILGHDERYLEVELGPHQHYLGMSTRTKPVPRRVLTLSASRALTVLQFSGVHACTAEGLPVEYTASIDREGRTWQGQARLPKSYLPPRREGEVFRINAYAIRGEGAERRYLAMYPSTGGEPTPNFHRLQYFQPIDTTLAQRLDVKRDAGTSS